MGRRATGVSPDTTEKVNAVASAREAVTQYLKALQLASDPRLSMEDLRKMAGVGNGTTFSKHFKPGGKCDFPGTAARTHDALDKLGETMPSWLKYIAKCTAKRDAALVELNKVLGAFGEEARSLPASQRDIAPFSAIDPALDIFGKEGGDARLIPLPSFEDYKAGRVVDDRQTTIFDALESDRLCYVNGLPSAGKTTVAMVAVFRFLSRTFQARYLRLTHVVDPVLAGSVFRTMLSGGERQVIIIDDAQRDPELTRELLRAWKAKHEQDSVKCPRLLIIGTRIDYPSSVPLHLRMEWPDETIDLAIGPDQLSEIARFYVLKAAGRNLVIPSNVAIDWSKAFGNHLHAFCFSLLAAASEVGVRDRWVLSRQRGLEWIAENWLHTRRGPTSVPIESDEHRNLNCLCVFANQDLELAVPQSALPCPTFLPFRHCRNLGIVSQSSFVVKAASHETFFELKEPGWGELILEAGRVSEDECTALSVLAMIGNPDLSNQVARRLRNRRGATAVRELIEGLDREGTLIPSIVNGSLGRVAGWLLYLAPADTARARVLFVYATAKVKEVPHWITDATLGQLANVFDRAGDLSRGADDESLKFIQGVAAIAPPADCPLLASVSLGVSAAHLNIFKWLPVGSPMFNALYKSVGDAIPEMVGQLRGSLPQMIAEVIIQIDTFFPEQIEASLERLSESDIREPLAESLRELPLLAYYDYVVALFRHFKAQPARFASLSKISLTPLSGTDWVRRTDGEISLGGAPWLAHWFYRAGLTEDAAKLANIIAVRKDPLDLSSGDNSKGHKNIELIAMVCKACGSSIAAQDYFEAMLPILKTTLEKPSLYSGIAAAGMSILATCDFIQPANERLLSSAYLRAHHRRATRQGAPLRVGFRTHAERPMRRTRSMMEAA